MTNGKSSSSSSDRSEQHHTLNINTNKYLTYEHTKSKHTCEHIPHPPLIGESLTTSPIMSMDIDTVHLDTVGRQQTAPTVLCYNCGAPIDGTNPEAPFAVTA